MAGRTLALRYGPPWPPISGTEDPGSWPDWHLTSSGVAHHIIPSVPFRPPALQVRAAWASRRLRRKGARGSRHLRKEQGNGGLDSSLKEEGRGVLGLAEEGTGDLDAWNWRGERAGDRAGAIRAGGPDSRGIFKRTSRAFYPVHDGGAPGPSRQAGSAHLGFRRGHQQMGDHLWRGSRGAQDPRRALCAAQGPKAEGPRAVGGDEGFWGKGKVPGCRGPRGTGPRTAMPPRPPSGWVPESSSCSSHAAAGASR